MQKLFLHIWIFSLVLSSSGSCSSGNNKKGSEFSKQKIYPSVVCTQDTSRSYALFIPPQYNNGKPCPVLILFDPHGDGLLPVTLFSEEAARNGFILAGSNNAKNGMTPEQTTAIYHSLFNDLNARLTLEPKAVYLGGFSGGSRVAGAIAITEGNIAGVIGCGAGLPNIKQNPVGKFSYLAIAGNQDFNLTEMQQLDQSLDRAGFTHHLLVFEGKHEWPPKELIPDIFTWLKFDAMRQKALPENRTEVNTFIEKNDKTASEYASQKNYIKQQEIYSKMMHYLLGLTDVAPLQSEIDRLASEKTVIAGQEKQKQLLAMEQKLQREYAPQIAIENIAWWKKETEKLRQLTVQSTDKEIINVYKRLLGYLSLNCYMYSTNALKLGDLLSASKFIAIYALVDPVNAEAPYLAAKIAALNSKPEAMFESLEKAVKLGFKDFHRLKTDTDFVKYRQEERFQKLLTSK